MAFSDSYFKDIVAVWIPMYEQEHDPHMSELLLRNILSRTYYTMFLHCREVHANDRLPFNIYTIGSHERIIELIEKDSVQTLLFNYKAVRKRADYELPLLQLPILRLEKRPINLDGIETLKKHLSTVLNYT